MIYATPLSRIAVTFSPPHFFPLAENRSFHRNSSPTFFPFPNVKSLIVPCSHIAHRGAWSSRTPRFENYCPNKGPRALLVAISSAEEHSDPGRRRRPPLLLLLPFLRLTAPALLGRGRQPQTPPRRRLLRAPTVPTRRTRAAVATAPTSAKSPPRPRRPEPASIEASCSPCQIPASSPLTRSTERPRTFWRLK